ncbi:MAG TPA: hypothetical protein VN843_22390 [Anaerolineales bacterium]|nr:hypothetical protein [Anaerolineales bacterium]
MKKLAIAVMLICTLSTSIFAGDIPLTGKAGNMPTTGKSEPPPPPPPATSSTALVSVILTILSLR